jgi:fluoroquinolone transport system permease protein
MGSVVLFEKSERVLNSIAISPVKIEEYVLSKLLSLAVISTAVGVFIAIGAGCANNIACTVIGVFLSSCLFSSIGLIAAAKIKTLNQFMIAAVPAEILLDLPAIAYLFGFNNRWLLLHPGVSAIELIGGGKYSLYALFILLIWTALFFIFSRLIVGRMMQSVGGIKL